MKKELNIFLSGFWLGIIVTIFLCILLMMCATGCSSDIAPKYKGTTKNGRVVEINPNTMKTWIVPQGKVAGYAITIDSISYDGYDSSGVKFNGSFVTAFRGKKPVATVFGNMAYYKP